MNLQAAMCPQKRCLRIRATPLGLARAAMLAQRGMILEVARKVGHKVDLAFVKLPERALAAPRFISQTWPSARNLIWRKLVAFLGHACELFGCCAMMDASQCS